MSNVEFLVAGLCYLKLIQHLIQRNLWILIADIQDFSQGVFVDHMHYERHHFVKLFGFSEFGEVLNGWKFRNIRKCGFEG